MKRFFVVLSGISLFALFLCTTVLFQTVESKNSEDKILKSERRIPNRYIVVFEDWAAGELGESSNAEAVAEELAIVYGGKIDRVFKHAISGYVVEINEKQAVELSRDPRVKFIEEDAEV